MRVMNVIPTIQRKQLNNNTSSSVATKNTTQNNPSFGNATKPLYKLAEDLLTGNKYPKGTSLREVVSRFLKGLRYHVVDDRRVLIDTSTGESIEFFDGGHFKNKTINDQLVRFQYDVNGRPVGNPVLL